MIYKRYLTILFFCIILILLFKTTLLASEDLSTELQLLPSTQNVYPGEKFTVNITVKPAQPIRGIELKISFNPLLIYAEKVEEGALFKDYTTIFNNGTIDNKNGTITKIYSVIIGSGNTTKNGIFATLSFTAKQKTGRSAIHIFDVRVTNETELVPIVVYDSNVDVGDIDQSENQAPNPPEKPFGSIYGFINTTYHYSSLTYDADNDELYYLFNWGDNTNSGWIGPYPSGGTASSSKTWNTSGTYNIKAKAKDEHGNESNWSLPLIVTITNQDTGSDDQEENMPPVAQFTYHPTSPITKDTIQFTDHSTDLDGTITQRHWDFGDNTNATAQNPNHKYTNKGVYNVTLTIWDDNGATNTTTQHVIVANTPPIAKFTYTPTSPLPSETIQFIDQSIDKDGDISKWLWDFGDNTTSTLQHPTHQYTTNRTYIVTLTVWDDNESTNITYQQITISNIIPETTKSSETPGLDLITFLIAIAISSIILKRKKIN